MSEDIQPAPVLDESAAPIPELATEPASLAGRLSSRRNELKERKPFDIPVNGYEGILVARYHALDYRVIRSIGLRQKDNRDQADAEVKVAADTLVTACDEVLEVLADGSLQSTGYKWAPQIAWDLFGVGLDELPEQSTARDAIIRVLDPVNVVLQYAEYDTRAMSVGQEVDRELQGESEASSAVV